MSVHPCTGRSQSKNYVFPEAAVRPQTPGSARLQATRHNQNQ